MLKANKSIYLWEGLSDEEKMARLIALAKRPKQNPFRRDIDRVRIAARRKQLVAPRHLNNEVWSAAFGTGGTNLADGWARIFALTRFGRLLIYRRVRLEEAWVKPLVVDWHQIKALSKWPRGSLPKSNPWKDPFFSRVVVAVPIRDKATGQLRVEFDCKPPVTYYFHEDCIAAPDMEGWLCPRRQNQGKSWQRGMGVIKGQRPRPKFVPMLTAEEMSILATRGMAGKTHIIRRLHMVYRKELKAGTLTAMDIKDFVDELCEAIE